jgi:hypothetical protein
MIKSYLKWDHLKHYLDDFIEVFSAFRESFDSHAFDWLMKILRLSFKTFKIMKDTIISIFDIEIDTNLFIVYLLKEKIKKTIKTTFVTLIVIFINLIEMQSLIEFWIFCSRVIELSRVFMRRFWNFVTYEFYFDLRIIKRRISQ